MSGENIITFNFPNFITVGLIAVLMISAIGFATCAANKVVAA